MKVGATVLVNNGSGWEEMVIVKVNKNTLVVRQGFGKSQEVRKEKVREC
jgi:type IV secretory pathway VirB9-like protein